MLKLALRNVFRHKLRTGMTLAAILFGVAGLILSGGFVEDLYHQLGEALIHSQSGHLQVSLAGFHEKGTRTPENYRIADPESVRQTLLKQPGVADVMARVNFSALINNGRSDWAIIGEGVEPEREANLGTLLKITAGRQLLPSDSHGIMLGEGVAHAMKLRPGDTATLLLNTAGGALNTLEFTVVGTFESFSKDFDARAVRIPLAAAYELLGTPGANALVLSLDHTEDTARVAGSIRSSIDSKRFEVNTWMVLNDFYASTVALYKVQFGVLNGIILVLVLLSVANSVNMSAMERTGEFGTMLALGNRGREVFRLLTIENVLLGALGGLLGVAVGLLCAVIISAIGIPMPPPPNTNISYVGHIRIVSAIVALSFFVGFLGTVLAALLPAWRMSRVKIVDALRQNI